MSRKVSSQWLSINCTLKSNAIFQHGRRFKWQHMCKHWLLSCVEGLLYRMLWRKYYNFSDGIWQTLKFKSLKCTYWNIANITIVLPLIITALLCWFNKFVISLAEKDDYADNALAYAKELEELREFTKYEKEFRDASILEHHEVSYEFDSLHQNYYL